MTTHPLITAIFTIIMSFPPYHLDHESPPDREARVWTIAHGTYSAGLEATCTGPYEGAEWCQPVWRWDLRELLALKVAVAKHEAEFAKHVHANECRPGQCDMVRLRNGHPLFLARSLWQVHASRMVPRSLWEEIGGVEYYPTTRAAYAAAIVLGEGRRRCGSNEGALSFYARPAGCRWSGAADRMATYRMIISRLR